MKSDLTQEKPPELKNIPAHVAIIMDGNGRWAKKRLMNRVKGHEKGAETVKAIADASRKIGIKYLTLFAFSTENWSRPESEVKSLMGLLKRFIRSARKEHHKNNVKLTVIGQKHRIPPDILKELDDVIELTSKNDGMQINLALSYGSREEINSAMKCIARKIAEKILNPEDISEDLIASHLYTAGTPDPDLIIRTSGEYRLSNFLLWQAAYSEIYITETLWPDFTREEYFEILNNYQNRDRRFGKVACSTSNGG